LALTYVYPIKNPLRRLPQGVFKNRKPSISTTQDSLIANTNKANADYKNGIIHKHILASPTYYFAHDTTDSTTCQEKPSLLQMQAHTRFL